MRARFSKIEITPPLERMDAHGIGYWYHRAVQFTGIRDPLFVRALVAGEGDSRHVIISVDSILDSFGFGQDASARISRAFGIDEAAILITCTHTHSSPLIDRNNTHRGVEYGSLVADRIVQAAFEADRNAAAAAVSVSTGRISNVLYNRRPLLADGRVAELHTAISPGDAIDPGPVNDRMTMVKFRRGDGQLIGGLCHFGIHGAAIQCSELISSDCMGRAIQAEERAQGNDVVLLHLNGACGDIDPILMGDDQSLEIMTTRLADGIRAVGSAPEQPIKNLMPVKAARATFRAARRKTRSVATREQQRRVFLENKDGVDLRHHSGTGYELFLLNEEQLVSAMPADFEIPYQILRWGDVVLVGIAGEIFTYFGLAVQAACPEMLVLPVGLTGGAHGYFPAKEMFAQGGYEVACAQWCPIAPGETERLFARISGDLQRIAGSEAA